MRPIYIFAFLAVLFVIYTENQRTSQMQSQQQALMQMNLQNQQMAIQAANSPAGMIGSVVGGLNNIANLAGYGLE